FGFISGSGSPAAFLVACCHRRAARATAARLSSASSTGSADDAGIAKSASVPSSSTSVMNVFDRRAKLLQRRRGLLRPERQCCGYLREEMGWRTFDRICDIKRDFSVIVDYGCDSGHIAKHITADMAKRIYQCDWLPEALETAEKSPEVPTHNVLVEGENFFPFAENSLDLVVSSMSLHWINDLPGFFSREILRALKPDGCLLGSTLGGDSLYELRCSLQLAEQERLGGFAPHVSPFTSNADLGALMQNCGYALVSIDVDEIVVRYPSVHDLLTDLRAMGETNAAWNRPLRLNRDVLTAAAAIYDFMYGGEDGEEDSEGQRRRSVPATFQFVNFIGWKPHHSQQKPARRGSASVSLRDLGSVMEKNGGGGGGGTDSKPKS
ncbi:hypothetical protein BOX15_Mlig022689g1, partial [Macrostomum lignano]